MVNGYLEKVKEQKMKISFVIPCYASAKTLPAVVEEIRDTMHTLPQYTYEIILVNDSSPDNTMEIIHELCDRYDNIVGIGLAKNFGQHAALMAGFHEVTGDVIVCLDDDGQTPACEVGKLLEKIENGYDVVYAEYGNKQHSGFRNFGSKVNKIMTEYLLDKPKNLYISSYFAAKRFIVNNMLEYEHSYPYVIGLVLRATKNITNVPVNHRARMEGTSGYSLKKLLALWFNGFTAFSVKPLRIATCAGVLFAVGGFVYALYLIIRKLLYPNLVLLGWSSTISLLMIIGGIILLVLGIIGEYVGRIYICINRAPQFVVREKIGRSEDQIEK